MELCNILQSRRPRIVIRVLGNTGVGRSSLLNALLDKAAELPTFGSSGCTATVDELNFNQGVTKGEESARSERSGETSVTSNKVQRRGRKLIRCSAKEP